MSTETKNNIFYFDILRALATLAVITIHVNTPVMNMNYGKNMEYWWIGLIINNLVRFVIPIFLVISGATLLTKEYQLIDFYKKRFSRVFIPFLFWLPAYWLFRWCMLRSWERPQTFDDIIRWGSTLFVREGVSIHLWFVYMILFLYLFMPFIGKFLRKTNQKIIAVILIIWLLFNTLQSFGFLKIESESILFKKLFVYSLYVGYLVLGYFLHTFKPNFQPSRKLAISLYFATVIIAVFTTHFLSLQNGKQTLTIMGSFTINTFFQTVAIYYMFKNRDFKNKAIRLLIQYISNYSFGIYFVHIMVISLFYRVGIFWTMAYPLLSVPIIILLTLISSFAIIYCLRKIPFMAKFAG